MGRQCVLYDRICTGCGECDYCDLNPMKLCYNCGKCIERGKDYQEKKIDSIITPDHQFKKHVKSDSCGCGHSHHDENQIAKEEADSASS